MEQTISEEEFNNLMKIEGEVRGTAIKGEMDFILKEKGKEGLKKLADIITKLGYPLKYREIKPMGFYPLGLYGSMQLVIKRIFNFDNKKIQEMGAFESKISLIMRLFMKYFVSLERMVKEVPRIWRTYFSVGNLKVVEFNKKEKYIITRLENFRLHPIQCQVLLGYFPSVMQMIIGNEVSCEETKCVFRGDDYHEFLMKW